MSFRKAKIQNFSNSNLKQELYEGQGTKKGLHLVCGELMLLGLVEPGEDLMVSLEMSIFARNNPLLRFHWYD